MSNSQIPINTNKHPLSNYIPPSSIKLSKEGKNMFTVQKKDTKEIFTVYAIRDDKNGYPNFLTYNGKEWKYEPAKKFIPVER